KKKGILRLTLPFSVIRVSLQYQKNTIEYKKNIKRDVLNKRLPLEFYRDYQQALSLRNQRLIQMLYNASLKLKG
ncbi:glycosyl transferase, partial [Campylobacter coli]|nr:glycosyl transferase [Campylobacter coli]